MRQRPRAAARGALGGDEVTLAAMGQDHLASQDLVLADRSEAAAEAAGAAGVLAQSEAMDPDPRGRTNRRREPATRWPRE